MAKRANGEGTIRKRSDGRWEARYYNPYEEKQHSVYATSQKLVKDKLKAALSAMTTRKAIKTPNLSLSEWLDVWMSRYTQNIKPLTVASYRVQCNNHIKPHIGHYELQMLTVDCIQVMYNNLFKGSDESPGLSAKTIKNIHGVLHKALDQAVTNGYLQNNPSDGCVLPRVVKKEINPLSDADIKKFMIAAENDRFADIFIITLFTGMRQGEVLGLTWDNIDFESGVITICHQLQKDKGENAKYFMGTLKNNKSRMIVPAPYVMELLRKRKRRQDNDKLIAGDDWVGDELSDNLVFTDYKGQHLSHCTVYKHYKAIAKRIGVPESRFHDLRHSYAVIALQNGDDVKTVQATLGHHTAAFTLDVYGHVSNKMRVDSANRMENFIETINQ